MPNTLLDLSKWNRYPNFKPEKVWKVKVHGDRKSGEISVLWGENAHGDASWGWFNDKDKILVATTYHQWGFRRDVWDKHLQTAKELCAKLNRRKASQAQSPDL